MADKNEYVITISVSSSGGSGGNSSPDTENGAVSAKGEAKDQAKAQANAAKALLSQMGGKVVQTALGSYGNLTGDYVAQSNIQTAVSEGTAIASAIALGPTGIAIYAVDKIIQGYGYVSQIKRSARDAAFRQKRVGFSTERS